MGKLHTLLVTLSFAVLTSQGAIAYDLKGVDVSTLPGEPISQQHKDFLSGSWAEFDLKDNFGIKDEAKRDSRCKYDFGLGFYDKQPIDNLAELEQVAPGISKAKADLFISSDAEGLILAWAGSTFQTVKGAEISRIVPLGNGWFELQFLTKRKASTLKGTVSWASASTLGEDQAFLSAIFQTRLIRFPSGAVVPVLRDVTYGIPTEMHNRNKVLMRCENLPENNN